MLYGIGADAMATNPSTSSSTDIGHVTCDSIMAKCDVFFCYYLGMDVLSMLEEKSVMRFIRNANENVNGR